MDDNDFEFHIILDDYKPEAQPEEVPAKTIEEIPEEIAEETAEENAEELTGEKSEPHTKNNVIWIMCAVLLCIIIGLEFAIIAKKTEGGAPAKNVVTASPTDTPEPTPEPTPYKYVNEEGMTIESRFNPPDGYARETVEANSFGAYLRSYELKPYGEPAFYFSGAENASSAKEGVLKQRDKLVKVQQCADTTIMLRAEYLFSVGRFDEIVFNYSSGFKCDFESWAKGMRPVIASNGRDVSWVDKTSSGAKADDYSYENLVEYLKNVYVYANTDSLVTQFAKKDAKDIEIGDIFVATATELKAQTALVSDEAAAKVTLGHAVIVADIAVNKDGEKVFLLVEGTTPATEPCVVMNPNTKMGMWFRINNEGLFQKSTTGVKWKSTWLYTFDKTN